MNLLLQAFLISSAALLFAACESSEQQTDTGDTGNTSGLLQHTVYFYLKDDVTPDERKQFEEGLKELLRIEEIYKSELGSPAATAERDVTDHSFAYSIFTWFKTMEDYEVYAEHPDHLAFIEKFSPLWADVKVYDTELLGAR